MKRVLNWKSLWAFMIILVACATLALHVSASSALRPDLTLTDAQDSVIAHLSWSPVRDARGDDVAYYVPSLTNNGVVIASEQTTDTILRVAIEKIPGDTMRLTGSVYAVDVRGRQGATSETSPLIIIVPDPGPPAPEIRLDTIPLAWGAPVDSISMFFPAGNFRGDTLIMTVGDTLQACIVAWRAEQSFRPSNQAPVCLDNTFPAMLYRRHTGVIRISEAE